MKFEPNKVNIQKKNCQMEGIETVCINATVCFDVKLKSKEDIIYKAGEYDTESKRFFLDRKTTEVLQSDVIHGIL